MAFAKRVLGRTGLEVTPLGYGAMEVRGSRIWGGRPVTEEQADTILNAVLDAGINFIDTANDYGRSEEFIGKYLSKRRDEFYLATKCGLYRGSQRREYRRHAPRLDSRKPVSRSAREFGSHENRLRGHHAASQPFRRTGGTGRSGFCSARDEAARQSALAWLLVHTAAYHHLYRPGSVRCVSDSLFRAGAAARERDHPSGRGRSGHH